VTGTGFGRKQCFVGQVGMACGQWRAEGRGERGARPWASKAGGHPKSEIAKIQML